MSEAEKVAAPEKAAPSPASGSTRRSGIKIPAPYALVYVVWADHHGDQSWQAEDEVQHKAAICHTIGWELKNTDEGVTVIGCYNDSNQVGNIQFIMRGGILTYKVLRKGRIK